MNGATIHLPTRDLGGTAHLVLGDGSDATVKALKDWLISLTIPIVDQVWLQRDQPRAISIDEIRGFIHHLALAPVQGTLRIGIIEEADRLTPEAGNALLKFLEEPPRQTVVVLAARSEEELLPTIVSRCQRWRLELPRIRVSAVAEFSLAEFENQSLRHGLEFAKRWAEDERFTSIYDSLIGELRAQVKEGKAEMSLLAKIFAYRSLADTTVSKRLLAETIVLLFRAGLRS